MMNSTPSVEQMLSMCESCKKAAREKNFNPAAYYVLTGYIETNQPTIIRTIAHYCLGLLHLFDAGENHDPYVGYSHLQDALRMWNDIPEEEKDAVTDFGTSLMTGFNILEDYALEKISRAEAIKELFPQYIDDSDIAEAELYRRAREIRKLEEGDSKGEYKILYIHGLGGSSNSSTGRFLKDNLDCEVRTFSYPNSPMLALRRIKQEIESFHPDLVVASSLGAYYALVLRLDNLIVINPAMDGYKDINKAIPQGTYEYDRGTHGDVESYTIDDDYIQELSCVGLRFPIEKHTDNIFGLFGNSDELFSHYSEFVEIFGGERAKYICSGHKPSMEALKEELLPLIEKIRNRNFETD